MKKKIDHLPNKIPVFPLSNFIIFPRTTVPLNIFEPRYIDMVDDAMKSNRIIGMVQPKKSNQNIPILYNIGCAGKIISFNETNDGNYLIVLVGISRFQIIEELKNASCLEKIEDYVHKIGFSERTDDIVEPLLSNQWFLKMDEIVKPALEEVRNENIKFYPDRWTKIYNHWLNNIQDWCISRQLWWGHRIPVWYKEDQIYCNTMSY